VVLVRHGGCWGGGGGVRVRGVLASKLSVGEKPIAIKELGVARTVPAS